jgi:hypothetical protein
VQAATECGNPENRFNSKTAKILVTGYLMLDNPRETSFHESFIQNPVSRISFI